MTAYRLSMQSPNQVQYLCPRTFVAEIPCVYGKGGAGERGLQIITGRHLHHVPATNKLSVCPMCADIIDMQVDKGLALLDIVQQLHP